jgi:pilus assembly protein CpaF
VVNITEVQGMEGDTITLQDLFVFEVTDFKNGRVIGKLKANGLRPRFMEKFKKSGVSIPDKVFDSME